MTIHSSYYQPHVYPYNGDVTDAEIDRLQELTGTITLNRTKIQEVGRDGIVGWKSSIPTSNLTLRQLEYGNIEFYRKLANLGTVDVNLTDYTESAADIVAYATDTDGTFLGSVVYPKYRVASIGLNIGDPDALIERTFGLVGEDSIYYQNNNKYYIYKRFSASGGTPESFTVDNPSPVENPDSSGTYILRVLRVTGSTTTELTYHATTPSSTAYTYSAGTLQTDTTAGDVIKVYYSASEYVSGSDYFVENDVDLAGISADSCTVLLATGNTLSRLQSVAVDVTFDRQDIREIGNSEVVARSVRDTTVRITLGRILETWTIEEVLRGEAGTSYGRIDARLFTDDSTLLIRLYSDNTKGTFLMGYKFTELSPVSLDQGAPVADNVTQGTVLEGQLGVISTDIGVIA